MWVFRRHWEALWDTAKQASGALFELEEARVEAVALREQVRQLQRENAELRDWLVRQAHPGDVYTPWENTEPSRLYIPREVTEELAEAEAAVVPCPTCGQPHGSGGVCAGDVREAA